MATTFDLSFWNKTPAELKQFLAQYSNTVQTNKLQTSAVVTYSFYSDAAPPPDAMMSEILAQAPADGAYKFQAMTDVQKQQTRAVFDDLAHATGLKFAEVAAGSGNIRLGEYNIKGGTAGFTWLPTEFAPDYAPLFINSRTDVVDNLREFTQTIWHELGHAIGLKHPGPYGGVDTAPFLPASIDTSLLTIMSYNDYKYDVSYAPLDLMALVNMYGTNRDQPGMNYIFTRSADLDGIQSVKGSDYTINLPATTQIVDGVISNNNAVFWAYINPGKDKIDVSQCKLGDQGVVVDDRIGSISWSTDVTSVNIYDYAISKWVPNVPISNFANVRLYTAAEQTAKALSELTLTDQKDYVSISRGGMMSKILSGGGNDEFSGFDNGVTIDGSTGRDNWLLDGIRAEYQLEVTVDGNTLTNQVAESMVFSNVDRLNFDDLSLAFDYLGDAGSVYRLYSVYDHAPDLEGFGYWINHRDAGASIQSIAQSFVNSSEFIQIYGADVSNPAFVSNLYQHVLDRLPDAEGLAFWTNALNQGLSRTDLVVNMTESMENVADKIGVVATGMAYEVWMA